MKLALVWKSVVFISAIIFTQSVFAITPDEDDQKECKKPKFRDFVPADKAEVLPESAISFHVSRGADLNHVTLEAKGEKLPITVVNRVTYLQVTGKLPTALREGYARIHVTAKAADGDCVGSDGWLIKIKDTTQSEKHQEAK
ncbi:hypothetical protein [Methylomonas sp. AM2-LC]|uniref:hypothetical protein n=1 Tax=Methylomonas sp. AM2-LC TaxID=3153301 RepID=UPI0032674282